MNIAKSNEEYLQQIDDLLQKLVRAEDQLERGWAGFGALLAQVKIKKYWEGKFDSFNAYLLSLKEKFDLGRVQLYAYAGTAEKLLGCGVTENQLNEMGISKASLLKDAIKQSGKNPTKEIIQEAVNPEVTIQDLRRLLFEEKMIGKEQPTESMSWVDLGFYATKEQRIVIEEALRRISQVDPVVQTEDLMRDPSAIRECILRMAMETIAQYGAVAVD